MRCLWTLVCLWWLVSCRSDFRIGRILNAHFIIISYVLLSALRFFSKLVLRFKSFPSVDTSVWFLLHPFISSQFPLSADDGVISLEHLPSCQVCSQLECVRGNGSPVAHSITALQLLRLSSSPLPRFVLLEACKGHGDTFTVAGQVSASGEPEEGCGDSADVSFSLQEVKHRTHWIQNNKIQNGDRIMFF